MSDKWYIEGPLEIRAPKSAGAADTHLTVQGNVQVVGTGNGLSLDSDPKDDTTPSLSSITLSNRAINGGRVTWRLYTAAVGGGWGVEPNAFEIWSYEPPAKRFVLRYDGTTLLAPGGGNVGIGTNDPKAKLEIVGGAAISDGNGYAVPNKRMASGSLTIGSTQRSYGGMQNWNDNTAGLLLETLKNTEIAVHDAGHRIASLMYYEGDADNRITIGRDMHWGTISSIVLNGNVGIGATDLTSKLHVKGNAGVLSLEGADHAYIQLYPRGLSAGRNAWIGFGNPNTTTLSIGNETHGGRIDIFGDEALVVFNKQGVVVSKDWGGNGNLSVEGNLSVGGNVGIRTTTPSATLDINGSLKIGSNGTVITNVQAGKSELGRGTNTAVFEIVFPSPFPATPIVVATAHGRDAPEKEVTDTFVVTVFTITTTSFKVNVHRVNGGEWAQALKLDWLAISIA